MDLNFVHMILIAINECTVPDIINLINSLVLTNVSK